MIRIFLPNTDSFPRSVAGLSAAGEWHELRRMLPDFKGKRVLDIGCGFGWHCIYAAEQGAKEVIGTDISEKMLAVAREKHRRKMSIINRSRWRIWRFGRVPLRW